MFTLTDGVWVQVGADIDGENAYDNSGYSVAMNAAGDTVIIGATYNDGNGDNSGQARVFTLTDGVWVQVGADIDGETADDWSGWSVAMNAAGDTVIIGAPYNADNGDNAGHARVFTLTDGVWVQVGADIDGENADDQSGWSVAMNAAGDTVIIGAPATTATAMIRVMLGCLGQRLNPHRIQRLGLLRRCRIRGLSPRCLSLLAPRMAGALHQFLLPALKPRLQRPLPATGLLV